MKNWTFLRGGGGPQGGKGASIHRFISQLLLVNIWKCNVSNFIKNRTINEEFDCWGVKAPRGGQEDPISKIQKSPIQNSSPNPHSKFQHYSSIRKCLKIGRTEMGGERKVKKHIVDPILAIFKIPQKLQYLTFWHVDFCNTFVCVYWSDRSIKKKYVWMGTM